MDTDYAKSTSELAKAQIIQQAGTAMLAQANQPPASVLDLFGVIEFGGLCWLLP